MREVARAAAHRRKRWCHPDRASALPEVGGTLVGAHRARASLIFSTNCRARWVIEP